MLGNENISICDIKINSYFFINIIYQKNEML